MGFVAFMESLYFEGLDLAREPDCGRDIELWPSGALPALGVNSRPDHRSEDSDCGFVRNRT